MNRREFVLASAGSAASILAGCATNRVASDGGPASVRTEPPELQAQNGGAAENMV